MKVISCKWIYKLKHDTDGRIQRHKAKLAAKGFLQTSDWASCPYDRKPTMGYCVYLGGNQIFWCSKKQQVVARSSTEAEYRTLAHTTAEIIWIQSLLQELSIRGAQNLV
ncbi:putative mitochondrial protein [Abeliophyllum distichum]|uniref:Mitochondrial protein n=1 Tax=Abeliophyllum distichum TaxID=126358 RepID=A0ABD1W0X3_9LAMI